MIFIKHVMKDYIFSLGLLLLFGTQLFAQTILNDSTEVENLEEVVVTAQFSPKSEKNAIYKVKVINAKTIQAKAATNLTELLRHELNVDFSYNPAFGAGIELNGISKENIKILIDGVPLIGRVNGVLNFNQINLDNVERIEVIEGPVSVFYGTNAMGGTINIITKKDQKKDIIGSVNGYYESSEAKNTNLSLGYKFGKNLIRFESGYYYFNGLNTDDDLIRSQNWPKKSQYHTNVKYIRDIGNFKLRFSSDFSEEEVNIFGEISSQSNTAKDIDYTTKRWDNTLNFQGQLNNNKFLDVSVSYLNYDRFDTSYTYDPSTNSSELIINNPNENGNYFNTFFAKGQYANSNSSNRFNYVFGVEFESDYGKGNRVLDYKQNQQNTSFFSSVNYVINKFEIQPALRYTYNSSFKSLWSPALNLKYRFNNQHVIRFAYGNGYRAPSLKELYLDWTPTFGPFTYVFSGNENLKVESSHSFNLYYTFRKDINTESYVQVEPSFFYTDIKNLIGLSELDNLERHYINLNKSQTVSAVLDVKYKMLQNLQLNLGFSYLGRYNEYTDTFNSDRFLYTPSLSASVFYTYKPFELSISGFYKYSGKQEGHFIEDVNGTDVLRNSTRDDFNNLDMSLSKSFFQKKLAISLGAKNLFDVTDIDSFNQIGEAHERDIQLWGSTYYLQTKFNF